MNLLFGLLWFAIRGVVEGMVMVYPGDARYRPRFNIDGIRSHRWYPAYHSLIIMRDILLSLFVLSTYKYFNLSLTFATTLTATFVLGWECFEAAYSFARYARLVPYQENVLGSGLYFIGSGVLWIHIARLVIGGALISWGLS
jgi:hypothetical protein